MKSLQGRIFGVFTVLAIPFSVYICDGFTYNSIFGRATLRIRTPLRHPWIHVWGPISGWKKDKIMIRIIDLIDSTLSIDIMFYHIAKKNSCQDHFKLKQCNIDQMDIEYCIPLSFFFQCSVKFTVLKRESSLFWLGNLI